MQTIQTDFSGGMNQFLKPSAIAANEYSLGFNLRNRNIGLSPIKLSIEDTTIPAGKKQGVYAFDIFILVFVSGLAYYKNVITDSPWTKVEDLALDPTVDYIYTCIVPASANDFIRSLITDAQVLGSETTIPLRFNLATGSGSIRGLVVQDGKNTPWFIQPDGKARKLQRYTDWTIDKREYVPIMKQMAYADGILFGMDPDGVSLFRSVSGRPIDFVVNVTSTGDKGGDATTTSYSIGYNPVNCLGVNSDGNLLIGTDRLISILSLNFAQTIFAEPTFSLIKEYSIGIINQFAYVKYLPNYHFTIDKDGMRTFLSEQITDTNENRNSIFTSYIKNVLKVKQTKGAAIIFDDYLYASVETTYSDENYIIVYDNIRQVWVSVDTQNETIKMFAIADQSNIPILYGISDNKLYKFHVGDNAQAKLFPKAYNSGAASINQKLKDVYTVFADGTEESEVLITEYSDGHINKSVNEPIAGEPIETIRFNFLNRSSQCWQSQPVVTWQNDATLLVLEHLSDTVSTLTSLQQQSAAYVPRG